MLMFCPRWPANWTETLADLSLLNHWPPSEAWSLECDDFWFWLERHNDLMKRQVEARKKKD
jgi:hypothetical protein